jgi:hypothetical protein
MQAGSSDLRLSSSLGVPCSETIDYVHLPVGKGRPKTRAFAARRANWILTMGLLSAVFHRGEQWTRKLFRLPPLP